MKVKAQDPSAFLHEPDEWIEGTITGIETTEDRGYGDGLKWIVLLEEQDGVETDYPDAFVFTGQKLTPRTKLGRYIAALTGEPIKLESDYELDDFVGVNVHVMFERDLGEDGFEREKVVRMKTRKGKKVKGAKAKLEQNAKHARDKEAPF